MQSVPEYIKELSRIVMVYNGDDDPMARALIRDVTEYLIENCNLRFPNSPSRKAKEQDMNYEIQLGCCNPTPAAIPMNLASCMPMMANISSSFAEMRSVREAANNKKQETKMYIHSTEEQGMEQQQRNYLLNRLSGEFALKQQTTRETFHIDPDPKPQTWQELVDRINNGQFLIEEKDKTKKSWYPWDHVEWRNPGKPADKTGYTTALETLATARTNVEDTIVIGPLADGLAALKNFEATT